MNLKLTYSKNDLYEGELPENDLDLWNAFREGNQKALAHIYQQYFFKLYNYGKKIHEDEEVVKDCIQDLFIYVWKNRKSLSPTTSIKYYLFKALRRSIVDHLKKKQAFEVKSASFLHFEFEWSTEDKLVQFELDEEKKKKLLSCLNKLPKRQKEALFLRYYENLSPQEVSSIMSLNTDSTYVLLSKAIKSMRHYMQELISIGLPILLLFK